MKVHIVLIILMSHLCFQCFAMTTNSGNDIPIPKDDYWADIEDIDGIITSGQSIAFNGEAYITAERGATIIYVPFERIKEISIFNNEEIITKEMDTMEISMVLTDETQFKAKVHAHDEITGKSNLGHFRIRLDHIRRLNFLEKRQKSTPVP